MTPPVKPASEFLSRKKAATFLEDLGCPISTRSLEKWAAHDNAGKGPPFTRIRGRIVRYRRGDLEVWAKREMVRVE